ncbi:MAG: hypothetical protein ACK5U5_02645 [Burkholderiales bacterium]
MSAYWHPPFEPSPPQWGLRKQEQNNDAENFTLELSSVEALQPWLKRLLGWHLVQSAGRTQATRYFVDPSLLRSLEFTGETTHKRIEPHRLAALVLEDLQRYPQSAISEIHQRIGGEIHPKQVKRALEERLNTVQCALRATTAGGATGSCHEKAIGQRT